MRVDAGGETRGTPSGIPIFRLAFQLECVGVIGPVCGYIPHGRLRKLGRIALLVDLCTQYC